MQLNRHESAAGKNPGTINQSDTREQGKMTVKEIAAATGRTEQAVRAWLRRHDIPQDNGRFIITPEVEKDILTYYGVTGPKRPTGSPESLQAIESLTKQLEVKDKQIEALQAQLSQALQLLSQAQAIEAARLPLLRRSRQKKLMQNVDE